MHTILDEKKVAEEIEKEQKFTRGPGRYSQASLIKKMEEIGIGRPSTYASTISLITNRTYVFNINRAVWGSPLGYAISKSLSYFFKDNFMNMKEGVTDYLENYLLTSDRYA